MIPSKLKKLILVLAAVFVSTLDVSAQNTTLSKGWKEVRLCKMRFIVPTSLKNENIKGTDSCVAAFSDRRIKLSLDYGWYSGVSRYDSYQDFEEEQIEIDGKTGQLATYRDSSAPTKFTRVARIFVVVHRSPAVIEEVAMNMFVFGGDEKAIETAETIFRSIKFVE